MQAAYHGVPVVALPFQLPWEYQENAAKMVAKVIPFALCSCSHKSRCHQAGPLLDLH